MHLPHFFVPAFSLSAYSVLHFNMRTKGGERQSVVDSYPSLSHLLISTNLITDLPAMYSDRSTDESESCSDSGSDRCIRDHAGEAADLLQGNSPEIYCIYIFSTAFHILCCSSFFDVSLRPSSYC